MEFTFCPHYPRQATLVIVANPSTRGVTVICVQYKSMYRHHLEHLKPANNETRIPAVKKPEIYKVTASQSAHL